MSKVDIYLSRAERHLDELRNALRLARKEIKELKRERRQMQLEMKVADIADLFDRDRRTIYRWLDKGKLKSKKMLDVLELKNSPK